jgi:hypothetical protein
VLQRGEKEDLVENIIVLFEKKEYILERRHFRLLRKDLEAPHSERQLRIRLEASDSVANSPNEFGVRVCHWDPTANVWNPISFLRRYQEATSHSRHSVAELNREECKLCAEKVVAARKEVI